MVEDQMNSWDIDPSLLPDVFHVIRLRCTNRSTVLDNFIPRYQFDGPSCIEFIQINTSFQISKNAIRSEVGVPAGYDNSNEILDHLAVGTAG
jgi:hypothetical protein